MTRRRRRPAQKKSVRKSRRPLRRLIARVFVITLAVLAAYVAYLDYTVRDQFEGKRWALPARVYARPLELYPGLALSSLRLESELKLLGYRRSAAGDRPGSYSVYADSVQLVTRPFAFWDAEQPPRAVTVHFDAGRIRMIQDSTAGGGIELVRLDPLHIGSFYPAHNEDRVLVKLNEVPPLLLRALIEVEDRAFRDHHGVSPRAILRALWVNLRAGRTLQGGSTLTQQLVKNFFLSDERTLWRKANEAVMALLLEWRYDKDEILEAYLNEVYLGQDGRRAIHGFGLASEYYFGRPVAELDLPRSVLLVALARGASYYNPRRHPQRALARRDRILELLASRGAINKRDSVTARAAPLGVIARGPSGVSPHPAFMDLVRRQLRRDYREQDLTSEGLRIFTTLDPLVQSFAEQALASGVRRLERSLGSSAGSLEGAAVITAPGSAEVLAVVGGREPRFAGFNRALDAVRPIGSLIKPAIYLTALAQPQRYHLATVLDDSPLSLERDQGGGTWSPKNYDREYHGDVPLHVALAHSYNVPSVRLGLDVGIDAVIGTLRALGLERRISRYPSVLLGSTGLSPLEVAQMYQTLAGGGFRSPLRAIREVTDAGGEPLNRYPLRVEQVLPAGPVYLVNTVLQEAVRDGTGRALGRRLPQLGVAGKTGTTDDLRDSWFAGFAGDVLGVVWLGHDDNTPARLSGATGAMRVWGDMMARLSPAPLQLQAPRDVEWIWFDPASGLRGSEDCDGAIRLPFLRDSIPESTAPCAGGALRDTLDDVFRWFTGED